MQAEFDGTCHAVSRDGVVGLDGWCALLERLPGLGRNPHVVVDGVLQIVQRHAEPVHVPLHLRVLVKELLDALVQLSLTPQRLVPLPCLPELSLCTQRTCAFMTQNSVFLFAQQS